MALSKNDPSSFSNTEAFRTLHQSLDLEVDFKSKVVTGVNTLTLEHVSESENRLVNRIYPNITHFRFIIAFFAKHFDINLNCFTGLGYKRYRCIKSGT